jgi:hypothetical protein
LWGFTEKKTAKAVKSYQYWASSFIQKHELVIPLDLDTYGRRLATLECLSKHKADPDNKAIINTMSTSLFKDFVDWSRSPMTAGLRDETHLKHQKMDLWNWMAVASFGGLTLLMPMLIMVLGSRKVTALFTTSVFMLTVGLILARRWRQGEPRKMIAATAAYAAVLVVFVGAGTNT